MVCVRLYISGLDYLQVMRPKLLQSAIILKTNQIFSSILLIFFKLWLSYHYFNTFSEIIFFNEQQQWGKPGTTLLGQLVLTYLITFIKIGYLFETFTMSSN